MNEPVIATPESFMPMAMFEWDIAHPNEEAANQARNLYIKGNKSLPEISKQLHVDLEFLIEQANKHKWPEVRQMMAERAMDDAETSLMISQSDQLAPTADRHMEIAGDIERKIHQVVKTIDPLAGGPAALSLLCRAAKALSQVAPVSGKASGLEVRTAEVARSHNEKAEGNKRQPLVMVGFTVNVSKDNIKVSDRPVIDVTPETIA